MRWKTLHTFAHPSLMRVFPHWDASILLTRSPSPPASLTSVSTRKATNATPENKIFKLIFPWLRVYGRENPASPGFKPHYDSEKQIRRQLCKDKTKNQWACLEKILFDNCLVPYQCYPKHSFCFVLRQGLLSHGHSVFVKLPFGLNSDNSWNRSNSVPGTKVTCSSKFFPPCSIDTPGMAGQERCS